MYRRFLWVALGPCCAAAIVGCGKDDPLPPADVQAQIQTHLGDLLGEANASIANSWEVMPRPDVLGLLERVVGVDTPVAQMIHELGEQIAVPPAPIDVPATIAYLDDQLFDEASYLGDGIYVVSPAVVCSPSGDAGCTAQLARLDLRLHTTVSLPVTFGGARSDGGIVVAVQLGENHDEPLRFTLRFVRDAPGLSRTWLTAELDLDVLQRSLDALTVAGATGIPHAALSGHLTVTLRGDPNSASLRLDVDRPISVALAGASGDLAGRDAFTLSSAMTKVFDIILVSTNRPLGSLEFGLAETTAEFPAATDGKRVGIHLAGLIGDAALEPPPLQLDANLSLGGRPATILLDGSTARTIDLNPDDGGALFLAINRDDRSPDTGVAFNMLHTDPKLDLRMTADHSVLGDSPLYDVSQILLDGSVRATTSPDRIELRSGTFRIDTSPTGHGFTATAGQCITGSETTGARSPSFIQWTVGACN
jgi:hypothetical protein